MPDFETVRERLAAAISGLGVGNAARFAQFIRQGDDGGPVPCWGAIAERFEEEFPADEGRLVLGSALMQAGETRALLVFLQINRDRPAVLQAMVRHADRLPAAVQKALVALPEVGEISAEIIETLRPAARALVEASDEARAKVLEEFEGRARRIRAFRYFVLDTIAPSDEREREPAAPAVGSPEP